MELPTRDTPPLTIRQLLSHAPAFPKTTPGAISSSPPPTPDRRVARAGHPVLHAAGHALRVLQLHVRAARPRRDEGVGRALRAVHARERSCQARTWTTRRSGSRTSRRSAARSAIGSSPTGRTREEPPLPHGVFGAMGGLLTTAQRSRRSTSRSTSRRGRRATTRKRDRCGVPRCARWQHLWTPSNLTARAPTASCGASETGYGFGLRVTTDCRFEHIVAHGGGLPGFGSYMAWLPEYGVGMFAMATLTYSGPSEPMSQAWDAMLKTGGLRKRELPPSPRADADARAHLRTCGSAGTRRRRSRSPRSTSSSTSRPPSGRKRFAPLQAEVGACAAPGPSCAENWLRGQFNMTCARDGGGVLHAWRRHSRPPVQHLAFQKLASPSTRMGAPTGAPAGVSCTR